MKLTNKDFLTLKDFSKDEILALIKFAKELKEKKKQGITGNHLQGKNIALIFEKPSTRTRCAFVVACNDEKAYPEYLGANDIQLGKKESIQDTARVLSRMFDGIEFRGFNQSDLETLAKYSDVPVWNGLTNEFHPTQILADMLTIYEHFNKLEGLNFAYIGDGRNNMANSLMIGCAKLGLNYINISPKELHPDNELINLCKSFANNSSIKISDNIEDIKGADIIYTDVWCSMGEEEKAKDRINILKPYQVNDELLLKTGKNTIIMHCLPAVKGNEITENVFENNADIIFNQAENRMHTIKAVMIATICNIDI
ncbi:ornithine carbamoyltransferase [Campylobacter sp. RM12651]|uniref:ornithine carbamoyltransferase n=1 Tax=Campylobacter sp. RM12651 TaxID=1660079 RepID=UPI001EFA4C64|nr:ornithine carbamoyltransferase [Campylobacter sp. RM12651]ULO04257.1 ornithine carbamoyltransferase [Campylobacter sp. RM12651]